MRCRIKLLYKPEFSGWYMIFGILVILETEGGGSMEEFSCKTKIVSGADALGALENLESKRLFVVSDPYFAENGTAKQLADRVKADAVRIFAGVQPDPAVDAVAAGAAELKEFAPDTVIALGGGSAIDCAKAMVHFSGQQVYFVAIPTTSGSGSEVTDFAVLTHEKTKHPLVDARLRPDMAILDASFFRLPLVLAQASPIFHSSCEGKLGIALE